MKPGDRNWNTADAELRLGERNKLAVAALFAARDAREHGSMIKLLRLHPRLHCCKKRPRDSHARVTMTHDSERRPNGCARSTTSPLHKRSRWCGRMALKPCMPSGSAMYAAGAARLYGRICVPKNSMFCDIEFSVSLGIPLSFCSFSASSDIPICVDGHR